MPTHYEILGLSNNCSPEEIKKRYRELSLKFHPDRNPGDSTATEKFQKINEAYETLSDPSKRQQYDMFGGEPTGGGVGFRGPGGGGEPFADLFNMFFQGGMPGGPGIRIFHNGMPMGGMEGAEAFHPFMNPEHIFRQLNKPPPIICTIEITLEQSYTGCSVNIEVEKWEQHHNTRVMQKETLYLTIPPGTDSNEIIILRDRGNVIEDITGDVKVCIQVRNNTIFERQGLDLILKRTITLKEALCGFSFEVKHLNGKTFLLQNHQNHTIIHPGYRKTLPKMGMQRNDTIGNMIVEFAITFPEHLDEEKIAVLKDLL